MAPQNKSSVPKAAKPQSVAQKEPKKQKKQKKENNDDLKRISLEFLADVASQCNIPMPEVRKVMEALRKHLLQQLHDKQSARIPNVAAFRLKSMHAHPAYKKTMFGTEREIQAKPARKKLACSPLRSLKEDACK